VLSHLGLPELGLVLLLGMFLFGPERLPGLTQDAARLLQQVRTWGKGLREELRTELGPDLGDLDLVPCTPGPSCAITSSRTARPRRRFISAPQRSHRRTPEQQTCKGHGLAGQWRPTTPWAGPTDLNLTSGT